MTLQPIIASFGLEYSPQGLPSSKAQPQSNHLHLPQDAGQRVPKDSQSPQQAHQPGVPVTKNEIQEPSTPEHRVPKDQQARPWIKVRLAAEDADVAGAVEDWK